jgi:hypothetical protein
MQPGKLIVMTGLISWNNKLERLPCYAKLKVPSNDIRVVEDAHLVICHALAGLLAGEP